MVHPPFGLSGSPIPRSHVLLCSTVLNREQRARSVRSRPVRCLVNGRRSGQDATKKPGNVQLLLPGCEIW
jgi:hypothetical protein